MESFKMNHPIQEQAITRGLRGVTRQNKLPETHNRIMFYRRPSNPHEIKVIHRIYNPYTKAFSTQVDSNFHVAEPPEGAVEISEFHLQQLIRVQEKTPYRYGNK